MHSIAWRPRSVSRCAGATEGFHRLLAPQNNLNPGCGSPIMASEYEMAHGGLRRERLLVVGRLNVLAPVTLQHLHESLVHTVDSGA
jgi:hypothetical protein